MQHLLIRSLNVTSPVFRLVVLLAAMASVCIPLHAVDDATADDKIDLAQFYGFSGIEIFKLDERAFNLQHGDFNHDGLTDLLVVDNHGSCLRLLLQQTSPSSRKVPTATYTNDLTSDWRFDTRQVGVDRQIAGLATGDLNGDERIDVAYIGVPDRLIVRFQPENDQAEWTRDWSVRLPELLPAPWMISVGDLNGDKRPDIVVLGKDVTYVIYQSAEGELQAPETLINTSSQLSMIQIADLNGDGRNDLCYMANEGSTRGLCARLQTADGRLGPELTFDLNQPRSVTLADVDQQPGQEIITIESRTGRLQVLGLEAASLEEGVLPSRLVQYGIGHASGSQSRNVALGDIDGDGLTDIAITDPDQAQLLLYRQNGIDGLGMADAYPSLVGVTDVAMLKAGQESTSTVVLLSEKEGVIATSQFEDGRLTFPKPIFKQPEGTTLAAVETVNTNSGPVITVGLIKGSGRQATCAVQRLRLSADGTWLTEGTPAPLAGIVGARGIDLLNMDVNRDGRDDLLVVSNGSSEKGVLVLLQDDAGALALAENKGDLDPGVSSAAGLFRHDGDLLVARDSFVRSLSFSDAGWQINDQFNAGETSARLDGAAALDLDGEPGDEIVLVDTGIKKLRVLRKQDGLFRPWKEVDLGNLKLNASIVADLNGDQREDLLLVGTQHFAVLYAGRTDSQLKEIASFESDREDVYLADVIAGDINGDQHVDLSVIDTSIDGLEIMRFSPESGIDSVTHFRVFEEKRLVTEARSRGTQPREGLAVDVTNDGRRDLVILCHDRMIVYPQDPGPQESPAVNGEVPGAE